MLHEGRANSLFNSFVKLCLGLFNKLAKVVSCYVFEVWIVMNAVFEHFVDHLARWLSHLIRYLLINQIFSHKLALY